MKLVLYFLVIAAVVAQTLARPDDDPKKTTSTPVKGETTTTTTEKPKNTPNEAPPSPEKAHNIIGDVIKKGETVADDFAKSAKQGIQGVGKMLGFIM